jgi:DNA-binding IclR family transcriptional regulator
LLQHRKGSSNTFRLLDLLFENPFTTVPGVARRLTVTHAGAQGIVDRLVEGGILAQVPDTWPRLYVARDLLTAIDSPIDETER